MADDSFVGRHIGPDDVDIDEMLAVLNYSSLEDLGKATVPEEIFDGRPLNLPPAKSEFEIIKELREIATRNRVFRSFVGMGYHDCITPPLIQRNILENPAWYTQYTPYQPEISQGRLEALLNFQTMITDLTGLEIANASLLDESTAAAEAMTMCFAIKGKDRSRSFFVSIHCHPQTLEVVKTRADPLGINVVVGDEESFDFATPIFAALVQNPRTDGSIRDYSTFFAKLSDRDALAIAVVDLLSLTMIKAPGEFGADVAVGSTQRFGVPMGFGGPHAAFFATRDEYKRKVPGRIVGVSRDRLGKSAARLAIQTREQHIRRDKATSNICTAQVLLGIIASMYAVYHGPAGLKRIATDINQKAETLRHVLVDAGLNINPEPLFDTITVRLEQGQLDPIIARSESEGINLRQLDSRTLTISLDEPTCFADLKKLVLVLTGDSIDEPEWDTLSRTVTTSIQQPLDRKTSFLCQPVFNTHHSETEMLRYMRQLELKDLSLATAMIPLGSCTMKLNATTEMLPVTWENFCRMHPFTPARQAEGYQILIGGLESMLAELTGFDRISLQPNAGSQGEYAGLLVIKKFHEVNGERQRDVCLIPKSAHGTNPASATLAGMKVVVINCDDDGNVSIEDLRVKAGTHSDHLAALMITYPSTHGVFEPGIREICTIIHDNGGQVYMDGANLNAQIGLCRPGHFGPDVCHINLHKTFSIPHGGGGPGIGPIGVKSHLAPFLPSHPLANCNDDDRAIGPVSAAPWGSAGILPISWTYIRLMGPEGLKRATQVAILNANYVAKRLETSYPVLYKGNNDLVAHECIIDLRPIKAATGIDVEDVAKRLMDYGFHAPTVSFPVPGTMMIEPTESESKAELDRFCDALILIREEIAEVEKSVVDKLDNVLKNAPHTMEDIVAATWEHPYSREKAVFPTEWVREHKFWPSVNRIDGVHGDRNLVCCCSS